MAKSWMAATVLGMLVLTGSASFADGEAPAGAAPAFRAALRGHEGSVYCVAFSPDGKLLASGGPDKTVRLWDVAAGKQVGVLRGHVGSVDSVAFSPNGKSLASGSGLLRGNAYISGEIKMWDVGRRAEAAHVEAHQKLVRSLAFDPAGKRMVSASDDGTVKIWDTTGPKPILSAVPYDSAAVPPEFRQGLGPPDGMCSVALSPDGKLLAWGGDHHVRLWDVVAAKSRAIYLSQKFIRCVALSADGKSLAVAADDGVKVWPVGDGQPLTLPAHRHATLAVAFAADGRALFTGGNDGELRMWDLRTGKGRVVRNHNNSVNCLRMSPDGKVLAAARRDGTVALWDLAPVGKGPE